MKLLVTGALSLTNKEKIKIESLGYDLIIVKNELKPIKMDVSDVDGIICNSFFQYNDIKKFKNLRFVQITSSGTDRVPLNYMKKNGIELYTAKGVYSVPMAEWAVLKILEIYKQSNFFLRNQDKKIWKKNRNIYELKGKTVSIIGYGSIGQEIAKRLKGFEVDLIGVGLRSLCLDPYLSRYYSYNDDDFKYVIKKSDVVVITLPLTEETEGIFNYEIFSIMKDNSVIINLSRGKIIDEESLLYFLDQGKFLGCALDVFQVEPLPRSSKLWIHEKVHITPHNSFVSENNRSMLFETIEKNLKKIKGKEK